MPVATMPGNVRFRAFQLGLQSDFDTPVTRTRRMPWRFAPTVDPHWTTPDVDTGTLDPGIAPYRTAIDVTGQATGPLAADDASILWALLLKGGVSPTGPTNGAYVWDFDAASTTSDDFELVTADWGDEVVADQWRYNAGVLEQLQLQFPQDLGPIQITADFRFASADYPEAATTSLNVDRTPDWLYAADTQLAINDTAGSIGITPLIDSMHDAQIQINNNVDVKRFANGSNANFAVAGYGRGARTVQTTFTFAKSTQALAEVVHWLNEDPVQRFVELNTTSRSLIGGTQYAGQRLRFSGFWFTRQEQTVDSNTAAQLVCNHVYEPTLGYGFSARVKNRMATLLQAA